MLESLKISCVSISDFFKEKQPLKIPAYQRAYTWSLRNVDDLLQDWYEHFKGSDIKPYYLGSILLYKDAEGFLEIIDGQQRITTLLLLSEILGLQYEFSFPDLIYHSKLSKQNILYNYKFISNHNVIGVLKSKAKALFDQSILTIIETDQQDEAFSFFDGQNNRGIPLAGVDFLKSYHLRALGQKEETQAALARVWDRDNKNQFLKDLFSFYLWRSRQWKGKNLEHETRQSIIESFQKDLANSQENEVDLFPSHGNMLGQKLIYKPQSGIMLKTAPLQLQLLAKDYPFSLRQPIQKGIGFFLFTQKYVALHHRLFEKGSAPEFLQLVYEELIEGFNEYFRVFFKLCVLCYYDKFGETGLDRFILLMDYLLGSYRINQDSIVRQTVIKILRDQPQNLLDVIEMAYLPQEVWSFIESITNVDYYKKEGIDKGVKKNYKDRVLNFYRKNEEVESMSRKLQWINKMLDERTESKK